MQVPGRAQVPVPGLNLGTKCQSRIRVSSIGFFRSLIIKYKYKITFKKPQAQIKVTLVLMNYDLPIQLFLENGNKIKEGGEEGRSTPSLGKFPEGISKIWEIPPRESLKLK